MIRFVLSSLLAALFIFGCSTKETPRKLSSQKVVLDSIETLFGEISREQLYFDYPEWQMEETAYSPDSATLSALKTINGRFSAEIFLGTWCSDSEREVPRFFKIYDRAGLEDNLTYTLYAVNRKLKLDNGLSTRRAIERVPTFIFYINGEEIGRIVETPDDLLEKDLLSILSGAR